MIGPALPFGGIAGWQFLKRTEAAQRATFAKDPELARDIAYFKAKIGEVTSAEALVKDRRLLKVALGAFGLDGEMGKRALLRKVLEGGTEDPSSFANRMTAPGYRQLAQTFGFGNLGGAQTAKPGFADRIAEAYKTRAFEQAVGNVDDSMRLALNFRREIASIAAEVGAADNGAGWFSVMGSRPLRAVIEGAFGLPGEFARVDVDRQREMLRDKSRSLLGDGSLAVFKDPAKVEKVIARFLARAQAESGSSATSPALALLQGSSGSQGLLNLLAARG